MIQVRTCGIEDLDQLAELFDQYRAFYGKPSDIEAGKYFLKERLIHKESVIFVAEDQQNQLVGFTQLYPLFSSTRMKRLWLLNDLFVQEAHRGKGISKQLIERSKELCRQTQGCALSLETAKTNHIGNNLYQSSGFELDADNNYYSWYNDTSV
jgi:GNAT superfamily N-acetyltransferase